MCVWYNNKTQVYPVVHTYTFNVANISSPPLPLPLDPFPPLPFTPLPLPLLGEEGVRAASRAASSASQISLTVGLGLCVCDVRDVCHVCV